jgi:hypothetical protein
MDFLRVFIVHRVCGSHCLGYKRNFFYFRISVLDLLPSPELSGFSEVEYPLLQVITNNTTSYVIHISGLPSFYSKLEIIKERCCYAVLLLMFILVT